MSASHSRSSEHSDEALLHRLGYAQVLYREMGGFSNFAISFTIISILAGCLTSYFIAFNYGGPVAITWGWLIVGAFSILVSMAMGEIASAMPTAGALYFWASKLGNPAWGWFTGWFNLVGQISVTAAIDYGAATFTTALLNLWFPDVVSTDTPDDLHRLHGDHRAAHRAEPAQHQPARPAQHDLRLVAHGRRRGRSWWCSPSCRQHQSVAFVFTETIDNSGFSGVGFGYVFVLGLIMSAYTITGYDASAHMSEETRQASRSAAIGMVMSVVASVFFGFILLVAITFAVPDVQGTLDAAANAVVYIWTTSLGNAWAEFLLLIAVVAQFFCGTASVTSASRMMFAFSRDRAVPGSRLVAQGRPQPRPRQRRARDRRPLLADHGAEPVQPGGLPRGDLDRRDRPEHRLRPADHPAHPRRQPLRVRRLEPWQALPVDLAARRGLDRVHLRRRDPAPSPPTGVPGAEEFNWEVVNFSPITVVAAFVLFGGWYLISARKWFTGPVREAGSDAELADIERELRAP